MLAQKISKLTSKDSDGFPLTGAQIEQLGRKQKSPERITGDCNVIVAYSDLHSGNSARNSGEFNKAITI